MKARKTIKTPVDVDMYFIPPLKEAGQDAGYAVYKRDNYETSSRCAQFGTGMEGLEAAWAECMRLEVAYSNTALSGASQ